MLNLSNSDIWGIFPIRWRYLLVALVPAVLTGILFALLGWWSILIGAGVGLAMALTAGSGQERFFRNAIYSMIRIRSTDRSHRVDEAGHHEEARLARAVNRLADTVERTIAEETSRRLHHEDILNKMSDGVLVVDSRGLLQYSNDAAKRILSFEYSSDESSFPPLASKVNIFDINDTAQRSAEYQQVFRRMIELYNPIRYLEVVSAPIGQGESDGGRALLIVRDRSDEYRLGESMREFIANASHELRTPIAAIQASVETLRLGAINDPQIADDFLQRIGSSTDKMASLVTDLMELTLLESGRMSMHLAPIDPTELVDSVISQFEPIAERNDIELRADVCSDLPLIHVDREQIERVLENLVSNSLKFTPEQGIVTMRCEKQDSGIVFSVEDTGSGIDVDELPHIFERFYKSSQRSTQQEGFGLGLAIARNIVEMHKGEIEAKSVLGQGSVFTVKLPDA